MGDGGGKNILWLSGAPGVGKSAILQAVCEALAGPNSFIDASHFFARGGGQRERAFYFPATTAYQIALSSDWCRLVIEAKLDHNPAILRETFASQFRELVIDATKELRQCSPVPITIVIDALDECDSVPDQVALLELIFEAATLHGMRFLIASRPEQEIHAFFHRDDVAAHTLHVRLDEETFNTSSDIELFLRSSFARIRLSRLRLYPAIAMNGEGWPGNAVIRQIAIDSDAQFIYPHLIIESIDADRVTTPDEVLKSILEYSSPNTFSKLDSLYHQILSRCRQGNASQCQRFKEVLLGTLEVIIVWQERVSIVDIANILDVGPHVVDNVVRGTMRSLFKFDEGETNPCVVICHKSLRDFLLDAKRAGEFFIPGDQPYGLFYRILSRQPPSADPAPSRIFSRQHLMGVIEVLFVKTLKYRMTLRRIASAMDVDVEIVRKVVRGPQRSLFVRVGGRRPGDGDDKDKDVYLLLAGAIGASFSRFLLDTNLSGEFCVSSDNPDPLFLRILSRPPPFDFAHAYSRQDLLGVLDVLVTMARPSPYMAIQKIASVLGIPTRIVWNAVRGPHRFLFDLQSDTGDDSCDGYGGRISFYDDYGFDHLFAGIRSFLRDEKRSGELCIERRKRIELVQNSALFFSTPPALRC